MNAKAHTIEITITPDGEIIGEVKGTQGPSCTSLTAWLDEIGEVTVDKHTPDWYKRGEQSVSINSR